jgi:acetyl-CoA C-acetyltransferase
VTIRGAAYIAGAYEHPQRRITDRSLLEVHAEVAAGALADAGLAFEDVDAYFCDSDAPGLGPLSMADYLGLRLRHVDSTDLGGAAYLTHVGHAAAAIALGRCDVALITMAGLPRVAQWGPVHRTDTPEYAFEALFGSTTPAAYALAARRHMYEFGTTGEQLATVKVTASEHAQHNPHALLRDVVTVEQVLASPLVADPLHRLDCCVITDGGGALVVVSPAVARRLERHCVAVLGQAEAVKHAAGGAVDLTYTAAVWSGPRAFAEAGVGPGDVDYASIYDSFTITVVETVEDLGFCAKGDGGPFVAAGALRAPSGALPCNTDGGGLCNNHPGNRGGMPKVIEAVRQLRGEAHPALQVHDCEIAIAHGTGGSLATRMGSSTLVLGRDPVSTGRPA